MMKLKISKVKFSKEFHETAFYIQEREEIHVYSIEDLFKAIKQRGGTAIITIYEEDIGIQSMAY